MSLLHNLNMDCFLWQEQQHLLGCVFHFIHENNHQQWGDYGSVTDAEVLLWLEGADEDDEELFAVQQLVELLQTLLKPAHLRQTPVHLDKGKGESWIGPLFSGEVESQGLSDHQRSSAVLQFIGNNFWKNCCRSKTYVHGHVKHRVVLVAREQHLEVILSVIPDGDTRHTQVACHVWHLRLKLRKSCNKEAISFIFTRRIKVSGMHPFQNGRRTLSVRSSQLIPSLTIFTLCAPCLHSFLTLLSRASSWAFIFLNCRSASVLRRRHTMRMTMMMRMRTLPPAMIPMIAGNGKYTLAFWYCSVPSSYLKFPTSTCNTTSNSVFVLNNVSYV